LIGALREVKLEKHSFLKCKIQIKTIMKNLVLSLSFILSTMACLAFCKDAASTPNEPLPEQNMTNTNSKIWIKVGEKTFTATLLDNSTAAAFKALLPLKIKMNELHNNEKYADLSKSLPINPSVPAAIQSGDLMIYGSRTLVLFYKGFSTSYSYTEIGKIDNIAGLVAALGSGDVKVSFELVKD